jgi:hypothetical protein
VTYTKQNWVDGEDGLTPISADRLNYMEEGLRITSVDASIAAALVPPAGNDLSAVLTSFLAPFNSSMPYREPTSGEKANGVAGIQRLAISGADASGLLVPLGFTISSGIDSVTKRPYILATNEFGTDRSWGLYLADLSAPIRLIVEVPHPVSEQYTDQMGLQHWQAVPGVLLILPGAHKDATSGLADVSLHTGSLFHGVAASFADMKLPQIQYHGYADATAPTLTHVVSAGTGIVGSAIRRVSLELASAGFTVGNGWDSSGSGSGLTATTNVQGIDAASKNTTWIHVTANQTNRTSVDTRKLTTQAVIAAQTEGLAFADGALAFGSGTPSSIGTANVGGSSAFPAHLDHVHAERQATLDRITALETLTSPAPRGRVASQYFSAAGPTNITTTEVSFDATPFSAVSGRRYRVYWDGDFVSQGATGHPYFRITMIWQSGSTLNTGTTPFIAREIALISGGDWEHHTFIGEFVSNFTGTAVTGLTAQRTAGTGGLNVVGDSSDNWRYISVEDIGL